MKETTVIIVLNIFFLIIICYNFLYNIKEGFKFKKIGKVISKPVDKIVGKVSETAEEAQKKAEEAQRLAEESAKEAQRLAEQAAEEAQRQAEQAAEEARRLAEELNIQNALQKLVEPIANLKTNIMNTISFLKEF